MKAVAVSQDLPIVLIGAGGHARVLLGLLTQLEWPILGVCDLRLQRTGQSDWEGLPVLGDDSYFMEASFRDFALVNGVGLIPNVYRRKSVQEDMDLSGHAQPSLCHPHAFVDPSADIAPGVQIMAGATVQPCAKLEQGAVINTGASVDHHSYIGRGAHIAPGATICGAVHVGPWAFIGAGAVIVPGCNIGEMSVVAAGTTVTKDLPAGMRLQAPSPKMRPNPRQAQTAPTGKA